ncbi:PREDICTED: transcription factor VIP1-like [Tarenaya hassleriana]|uniref:transcription factor VIP1-like n=1 Tax=Tarenaya hassleriana TaxID=28532 RepID=UPI00053C353C|nr:PREDICTED: transcription factor VIP1-like [Tarenaya hassleriana]
MDGNLRANPAMLSEIDCMPDVPPRQRVSHHRRARSDTFFAGGDPFDDLLLFDPPDVDLSSLDFLSVTAAAAAPPPLPPHKVSPMAVDSPSDDSSSNGPPLPPQPRNLPKPGRRVRSLSVDSDFFDDLGLSSSAMADDQFGGKNLAAAAGETRGHHHRSSSMDGATSSASFNVESILAAVSCNDGSKKAMGMGSEKLSELALIDPKRAKRILANRQSAARSKERKIRYTNELEKKVQTLQNEATTLSAKVTMFQRGTSELSTENKQLKLRLQALEQQAQLRDALNEALRGELKRLKVAAGEIPPGNGNAYNRAQPPQFSAQQRTMHQFGAHKSQNVTNSPSGSNGQPLDPSFMDFTNYG